MAKENGQKQGRPFGSAPKAWTWEGRPGRACAVRDETRRIVCVLEPEDREAARRIGAMPEMLRALLEAADQLWTFQISAGHPGATEEELGRAAQTAAAYAATQAALAKAFGIERRLGSHIGWCTASQDWVLDGDID